ncbi:uncharacterized protein LOC118489137 [Helianthus annuus]|uniref:uncharacterized protein LOC118489136 n=1 Tax=Helianthus annuus TaxID=4232 RepID=UPI001652B975|nr:uncharacterized protein LOC118489136 [Helianthus annuus]XP_035842662.1 uncharacterized protein LOC118489137 [Helianthus annuus]
MRSMTMVNGNSGDSMGEKGGVGHPTRRRPAVTEDDGDGWLGSSSSSSDMVQLQIVQVVPFTLGSDLVQSKFSQSWSNLVNSASQLGSTDGQTRSTQGPVNFKRNTF